MTIIAICSQEPYTQLESTRLRGYPAVHAFNTDSNKTLCGNRAQGWGWTGYTMDDINCKRCLPQMLKAESKPGQLGVRACTG